MTASEVDAFLERSRTGVLTTLGRDGFPHSVAMWFVRDDRELLMWTYRKSQKARNALRDPRAAFLLESGDGYDSLAGVMIKGRLRPIESFDEVVAIGRRLYERYTFPSSGLPYDQGPNVEVERQASKRIGLALPLAQTTSWDHSKL